MRCLEANESDLVICKSIDENVRLLGKASYSRIYLTTEMVMVQELILMRCLGGVEDDKRQKRVRLMGL